MPHHRRLRMRHGHPPKVNISQSRPQLPRCRRRRPTRATQTNDGRLHHRNRHQRTRNSHDRRGTLYRQHRTALRVHEHRRSTAEKRKNRRTGTAATPASANHNRRRHQDRTYLFNKDGADTRHGPRILPSHTEPSLLSRTRRRKALRRRRNLRKRTKAMCRKTQQASPSIEIPDRKRQSRTRIRLLRAGTTETRRTRSLRIRATTNRRKSNLMGRVQTPNADQLRKGHNHRIPRILKASRIRRHRNERVPHRRRRLRPHAGHQGLPRTRVCQLPSKTGRRARSHRVRKTGLQHLKRNRHERGKTHHLNRRNRRMEPLHHQRHPRTVVPSRLQKQHRLQLRNKPAQGNLRTHPRQHPSRLITPNEDCWKRLRGRPYPPPARSSERGRLNRRIRFRPDSSAHSPRLPSAMGRQQQDTTQTHRQSHSHRLAT